MLGSASRGLDRPPPRPGAAPFPPGWPSLEAGVTDAGASERHRPPRRLRARPDRGRGVPARPRRCFGRGGGDGSVHRPRDHGRQSEERALQRLHALLRLQDGGGDRGAVRGRDHARHRLQLPEGLLDVARPRTHRPRRALAASCNPYFEWVGENLGYENIRRYAQILGLGEPSGINLTGETAGRVPAFVRPEFVGHLASHAAGIETSAVQLAVLVSATVNGGIVYQPQVGGSNGFVPRERWRLPEGNPARRRRRGLPVRGQRGHGHVVLRPRRRRRGKDRHVREPGLVRVVRAGGQAFDRPRRVPAARQRTAGFRRRGADLPGDLPSRSQHPDRRRRRLTARFQSGPRYGRASSIVTVREDPGVSSSRAPRSGTPAGRPRRGASPGAA